MCIIFTVSTYMTLESIQDVNPSLFKAFVNNCDALHNLPLRNWSTLQVIRKPPQFKYKPALISSEGTQMKAQRKGLIITRTATWLIAEVILNLVGLDNLADYSEFVFEHTLNTTVNYPAIVTTLVFDRCDIPVGNGALPLHSLQQLT